MMTDLSPAAQAVLDAATKGFWSSAFNSEGKGAAAALRAAADHFFTDWDATRCSVFLDATADELEDINAE